MGMSLNKLWEIVKNREAWRAQSVGSQRVRCDLATERKQLLLCCTSCTTCLYVLILRAAKWKLTHNPLIGVGGTKGRTK